MLRSIISLTVSLTAISHAATGAELVVDSRERAAVDTLKRTFPGVQTYIQDGKTTTVYGRNMTTGATPAESAQRFVANHAQALGARVEELAQQSRLEDGRSIQPLVYDAKTGKYKFSLVYYTQHKNGIPVFRGDGKLLVRNLVNHPVVLARSSFRNLEEFAAPVGAINEVEKAKTNARTFAPSLVNFTQPRQVIWAGVNGEVETPVLAIEFVGDNGALNTSSPAKWLFVADAKTGKLLFQEDQIHFLDITGNVSGLATEGFGADICAAEVIQGMPHARVTADGAILYTDVNGDIVIPNSGTDSVFIQSPVRGRYFRSFNTAGTDTVFFGNVVPPGPFGFVHNGGNTEQTRAEVNGYIHSNIVRDFVLSYNPAYPFIAAQLEMPVNVNMVGGICPGNAFYNGSSINFCASGGSFPNTAFAGIVHHEYGHHLVQVAGSGQGQYGEGMGDTVGMLIADDPAGAIGFFGNCNGSLRSADNTLQYPCNGAIHFCGQLISGAVWSFRNEMIQTNPTDYLEIVSNLTINSIPLHNGDLITPQITIDFLTLDDDDGNLENGTPHWDQICAGFGAHSMDCPPLVFLNFEYPNNIPSTIVPNQSTTIPVNVVSSAFNPIPGTGMLHYRFDNGAFTSIPMSEISPNEYDAVFPAEQCGALLEFYVSTDTIEGGVLTDPEAGALAPYVANVSIGTLPISSEDFEAAPGWTIAGSVFSGAWERGVPVSASTSNSPLADFDGSGQCFVTENGESGSSVSSGSTILTSAPFDLSLPADPRISYARWYDNAGGGDTLDIEISNDDGATWVSLETVGPTGPDVVGGWITKTIRATDFVTPTMNVRLRFTASRSGGQIGVEAAIDAIDVIDVDCGAPSPASAPAEDDIRKNRYVSFQPAGGGTPVNHRLELVAGPGTLGVVGWVGAPDANGVSRLEDVPPNPRRVWNESVIHVADCAIVPDAKYAVKASADDVSFSAGELLETAYLPLDGRKWGDVVGLFDNIAIVWLQPDGTVNGFDVVAVLQNFSLNPNAPHFTRTDVNPQVPDKVTNGNDVLQIVNAFGISPYPFVTPDNCP